MIPRELSTIVGKNDKVDPLSPIESDPLPPGLLDPPILNRNNKEPSSANQLY
jgi:hypothetical protein